MNFKEISYTNQDLIYLIKNNTAAIIGCDPRELFVELRNKDGRPAATVFRTDKKEIVFEKL